MERAYDCSGFPFPDAAQGQVHGNDGIETLTAQGVPVLNVKTPGVKLRLAVIHMLD